MAVDRSMQLILRRCGFAVWLVLMLWPCAPCLAIKPSSPEVRKAVERGLRFLEIHEETRLGGKCLVAMAFLKNEAPSDHAKVAEAVRAVEAYSSKSPKAIAESNLDIYSHGLAIGLLCEVDSSKYHTDIENLLRALELRQKECGGWGYLGGSNAITGDTSMTQYAVLATWTASRHGVAPKLESIEKVTNWLIRTQDPSGVWGYQGKDTGAYNRVPQEPLRQSLAAAGLGATFICSDLLGMTVSVENGDAAEGLPSAFKLVREEKKLASLPLTQNVDARLLQKARTDGSNRISANEKTIQKEWFTYYLYALERYYSFRELSEGKSLAEPEWYTTGAKLLLAQQAGDGSWTDECQSTASTSLAILFLCRGTKKTIAKTVVQLGEGILVGGRGLPTETKDVRLRNGAIVGKGETQSMQDILAILEQDDRLPAEVDSIAENVALSSDPQLRQSELGRLRRLLRGGNFEARFLAVKALGGSPDLANAPALIFAVGDPDERVAEAAHRALQFLSRQFTAMVPPGRTTQAQRMALKKQWEEWYLSIHPSGELLD